MTKNPKHSLEEYILPSDHFMTSLKFCPLTTTGQKDSITSTDNQVLTKKNYSTAFTGPVSFSSVIALPIL